VLLRQEVSEGVEVLSVRGPVGERDAGSLVAAVERVLSLEPRAVVLDLNEATVLTPQAQAALQRLESVPNGWPRPSLVVCLPPEKAEDLGDLVVALDRDQALAHVDARPEWPRTQVVLEHGPQGPAQARAAVAQCAQQMGLEQIRDDLILVVSEMVTNAIRHASPPVCMEIEAGPESVLVSVWDGSPGRPMPRVADEEAEGGRGLLLVDLLCSEHGVRPQPLGKAVWARLPLPGEPRS